MILENVPMNILPKPRVTKRTFYILDELSAAIFTTHCVYSVYPFSGEMLHKYSNVALKYTKSVSVFFSIKSFHVLHSLVARWMQLWIHFNVYEYTKVKSSFIKKNLFVFVNSFVVEKQPRTRNFGTFLAVGK